MYFRTEANLGTRSARTFSIPVSPPNARYSVAKDIRHKNTAQSTDATWYAMGMSQGSTTASRGQNTAPSASWLRPGSRARSSACESSWTSTHHFIRVVCVLCRIENPNAIDLVTPSDPFHNLYRRRRDCLEPPRGGEPILRLSKRRSRSHTFGHAHTIGQRNDTGWDAVECSDAVVGALMTRWERHNLGIREMNHKGSFV